MKNLIPGNSFFFLAILEVFVLIFFSSAAIAQNAWPFSCEGSRLVARGAKVSIQLKSLAECRSFLEIVEPVADKSNLATNLEVVSINSNFLKPFKNDEPDEGVGFPLKDCRVPSQGNHVTKSRGGFIVPECTPDTLYSWGGFEKLKALLNHMEDGWNWRLPFSRTLFATSSAAATFGYGVIPIRMKIRPDVKFKLLDSPRVHGCEEYLRSRLVSESEIQNTIIAKVFVGSDFSYLEYSICSPAVIESWSFATPEHYDEILADHKWMISKDQTEWEGYSKQFGKNVYLENSIDQNHGSDFRVSTLHSNLQLLRALTEGGFGRVLFSTKYWRREPQIEKHFQTGKPIYFNPN